MYQLQTRLTDVLNYPLPDRIRQLVTCIETAPIKDLQAFFPTLVHHIFGFQEGVGWGLRIVTDKNFYDFKILYEFFHPHGTFFQLIYRLLTDANKYEIKTSELPIKLRTLLETGRYSSFYANILVVDHFQPRNLSLSLNAFDYFMFHFCIHGMKNLHKVSQAALNVNNENSKTVYFNLAADYLCNFLPSDPHATVYPQIDCSPVKTHSTLSPLPLPTMSPTKPTKYLLLSSLSHQIQQNPTPQGNRDLRLTEAVKTTWRSESVMMIFIDCWLRYDIEESWELPGNEFIRLVRILVKQLHFFGNVAEQDLSIMSVLRQQAQSLLNLRIYPLLKTVISRWPLDTSFINVLELYLSYIQPWRYVYNRNIQNLNTEMNEIPERFKVFINENLLSYTQIFVRLVPRFIKMDLSLSKNAFMLFRLMKVFRPLNDILRDIEKSMMNNSTTIIRSHSSFNESSIHSSPRTPSSFNRSGDRSPHPHHRSHNQSAIEDSSYVYMFSDEVRMQMYELMQRLYLAKLKTDREVEKMEKQLRKHTSLWEKFMQLIGWFSSLSLSFSVALEEKKKTPIYLDFCLNILSPVYNIPIEDVTRDLEPNESLLEDSDNEQESMVGSDVLNITPSFMKQRLHNITYTGDPLLLPIMGHEVKFLVRFLHQISSKINEMFENEFELLWNRNDLTGKIARQVLCPPVETRVFDKSAGYSEMKVKQIGPRLSLRKLASRKFLILLVMIFMLGRLVFGASSLGFITFAIIAFGYLILKAIFST